VTSDALASELHCEFSHISTTFRAPFCLLADGVRICILAFRCRVQLMGLRFRRSWGVVPGVRLNLGLKSGSVSFGVRGLHYTVGDRRPAGHRPVLDSKNQFTNRHRAGRTYESSAGLCSARKSRQPSRSCCESGSSSAWSTDSAPAAAYPAEPISDAPWGTDIASAPVYPPKPISDAPAIRRWRCSVGTRASQAGLCANLAGVGSVRSHRNSRTLLLCGDHWTASALNRGDDR